VIKMSELNVSEYFYSIQGEGQYQGYPAVFFRLQNCNLFCGQPKDAEFKKKCEGCKWVCDTIAVWMKGNPMTYEEILKKWDDEMIVGHLSKGAHLVLTGGEPLLQQNQLKGLVYAFVEKFGFKPFIEVETNGTVVPTSDFAMLVDRFNVSAKLSNSGNAKPLRYKHDALQYFTDDKKSIFKFVTVDDEDTNEIFEDFINPFKIPRDKIWLMPGAYDREELWRNGQSVAELCKKYGFKMTSRMHVEIWDKLTGV
jgi:7-carboxy-7-deazaguanine synthase